MLQRICVHCKKLRWCRGTTTMCKPCRHERPVKKEKRIVHHIHVDPPPSRKKHHKQDKKGRG